MNQTIRWLGAAAILVCASLGLLSAVFGNWPIAVLCGIGAIGWAGWVAAVPRP